LIVLERLYIGVAGVSEEPERNILDNVRLFIDRLADRSDQIVFLMGGYWGFMRYFADYAIEKGFQIVFILPDTPPTLPPNRENTIIINTDLGFPTRSTILCKSSDLLVVFGGRIGSIIEVLLAYNFGKPVLIIKSGYETDNICGVYTPYIDQRKRAPVYCMDRIDDVIDKINEFLEKKKYIETIM